MLVLTRCVLVAHNKHLGSNYTCTMQLLYPAAVTSAQIVFFSCHFSPQTKIGPERELISAVIKVWVEGLFII